MEQYDDAIGVECKGIFYTFAKQRPVREAADLLDEDFGNPVKIYMAKWEERNVRIFRLDGFDVILYVHPFSDGRIQILPFMVKFQIWGPPCETVEPFHLNNFRDSIIDARDHYDLDWKWLRNSSSSTPSA